MTTQKGFTLLEVVLVITLIGVLAGVLGLSLYKPIQDVFALNQKASQLAPIQLSLEQFQRQLHKPQHLVQTTNSTITLKFDERQTQFKCIDSQWILVESGISSVLLDGVDCKFNTIEDKIGWHVHLQIKPLGGPFSKTINRIYYISKADS